MDTNHDGKLDFDEWAYRGIERFAKADADKSGTLNRTEFATTAAKRKTPARPKCDCVAKKPAAASADAEGDGEE